MEQDARVEALRTTVCGALYTDDEMAKALKVSVRTLYRLAERGMPTIKIGGQRWYNPKVAAAWLSTNCATPARKAARKCQTTDRQSIAA